MPYSVECYSDIGATLGEGPLWDIQSGQLYTIDCMGKTLFCHDAAGAPSDKWSLPRTPGSFAVRENGGILMAYRRGLALIEPGTAKLEDVPTPEVDFAKEIFNDGKCDRLGRFWVGTMDFNLKEPVGALYRVDADLSMHRMDTGITLSNGISWSPDNRTMYYCDSRPGRVLAYDFDLATGTIENRRVLIDFAGRKGRPDGCTVDAEGGLWIAEISASQIVRFDPSGREVSSLAMPVSRPTSVMFGGQDLHTLFITSMRHGLTPDEAANQPLAGCLFAADVGVAGLAEVRFAR